MTVKRIGLIAFAMALLLAGCGESQPLAVTPTQPLNLDRSCDLAAFPSAAWTACELQNYAKTGEAPIEQLSPAFQTALAAQLLANVAAFTARAVNDPSWLSPLSGNTGIVLPLCATGVGPCVGDPFRYPAFAGPDGTGFYEQEATVTPVVFYDRDCARLSGRVWLPKTASDTSRLPNIVFTNGSVQAPEVTYWWIAQALVRAGYAVLTYDPRGQGLSDLQAPDLEQGTNLNPKVFWEGQVDAIDFFRSTPSKPYPHEAACAGTYPTPTAAFNPIWTRLDAARLGIAGHSLGAIGVSVVQGYGAPGADPWPGLIDSTNPVKVTVAFDSLITPDGSGFSPVADYPVPSALADAVIQIGTLGQLPKFGPRTPALSFNADYGLVPVPYLAPPDSETHKIAFAAWQAAGIPAYAVGIQGTTHFDFSLTPLLPTTSWCPDPASGSCHQGWGNPAIERYTVAWFDRWLKRSGESGYDDADLRLVDDANPDAAPKLSFRYRSARDYPDRGGKRQHCEDIRAGCS